MSVLDVVGDSLSPNDVLTMDLPLVMDLVRGKVRLEQAKTKAQKVAKELAMMQGKK